MKRRLDNVHVKNQRVFSDMKIPQVSETNYTFHQRVLFDITSPNLRNHFPSDELLSWSTSIFVFEGAR